MDSSLEVHVDVCGLYMCVQRGLGRGGNERYMCVQRGLGRGGNERYMCVQRGLGGLGRVGDKKCVQPNK